MSHMWGFMNSPFGFSNPWFSSFQRAWDQQCGYEYMGGFRCPMPRNNFNSHYCEHHTDRNGPMQMPMNMPPAFGTPFSGPRMGPFLAAAAAPGLPSVPVGGGSFGSNSAGAASSFFSPGGPTIPGADYWQAFITSASRQNAYRIFLHEVFGHTRRPSGCDDKPNYFPQNFPLTNWFENMPNPWTNFNLSGQMSLSSDILRSMFIREVDRDNWPFYLKCPICRKSLKEPVQARDIDNHPFTCCRACIKPTRERDRWRHTVCRGPLRPPRGCFIFPAATALETLRRYFTETYIKLINQEAPRQICGICTKVMEKPTVTCDNVDRKWWTKSHGGNVVVPPVRHAFCAPCLDKLRYGRDRNIHGVAACPFKDKVFESGIEYPVSQDYMSEQWRIAGKAWEKTLCMAYNMP